jgi:glucose/arabinose dehydrogenase
MKKVLLATLGVALAAFAAWAVFFYYQNLRGVGPALGKPSGNIAQQIDTAITPVVDPTKPVSGSTATNATSVPLQLPAGFSISIFAKNLGDPRAIVEGPDGLFLVSIPAQGKVIALEDMGVKAGKIYTVAEGLDYPHGLATKCDAKGCKLFVGETMRLDVFDYDKATHTASNRTKLADLPSGGNHITRSLLFLPPPNDSQLLISIGSSCNVCHESDPKRATIYTINADGTGFREYSKGLRNSVFMAANPATNQVWATENGRDLLGDNIPPDEVNIIQDGKNYGWPICYGQNVHDTQFDKNTYIRAPCMEPFETPSHIDLQAHSAPLGLAFFPEKGWPAEFQNNLLVAFHGSWNRSVPTGYKVVRIKLDGKGNVLSQEDFITGWLQPDGTTLGRPVDPLIRTDGSILLTDDKAGVIYKLAYSAPK